MLDPSLSRRKFLQTTAAVSAAAAFAPVLAAAPTAQSAGETLVAQLYKSLNEDQRTKLCFPFDHPLRSEIDNNWFIVEHKIAQVLTADQQDLVKQIFLSLHSDAYAKQVLEQVEHDNGAGGLNKCAVALFGEPGGGKFEFVLTGRHVTRRCDGDSVAGTAFGGPIFYGHAAGSFNEKADHAGNVYWFQAKSANALFQALDGKQRETALREDAREEQGTDTVRLTPKDKPRTGLPASELSADQRGLLGTTLRDLLAPFRAEDATECMKLVEKNGGLASLSMTYYKNMDISNDGVWDVWQVEGPAMLWYFRGKPHVHTWVNVKAEPECDC